MTGLPIHPKGDNYLDISTPDRYSKLILIMHRLFQHMMLLFIFLDIAAAALPHHRQTLTRCPIIFDGRTPLNATLSDFDDPSRSPFNTKYVKGENLTWSSIIQWPPSYPPSRFDPPVSFKPLEITIDDQALFRSYQGLQLGFRRAGLQFKNDVNDAGADEADNGTVTFHWSVQQDLAKPLNLTHEYMNVWLVPRVWILGSHLLTVTLTLAGMSVPIMGVTSGPSPLE